MPIIYNWKIMLLRLVCSWDTSQMPQLCSMTIGTTLNVTNDKVFVVVNIEMLSPSFLSWWFFFYPQFFVFTLFGNLSTITNKTFHSFFNLWDLHTNSHYEKTSYNNTRDELIITKCQNSKARIFLKSQYNLCTTTRLALITC
jgi:hypothetical protein